MLLSPLRKIKDQLIFVFYFQEETEAERQKWTSHSGNPLNSKKSNPKEAEEPPVQSEPVDLSRRSDQNQLEKILHKSSLLEDTKNNNDDDILGYPLNNDTNVKMKKEVNHEKNNWDLKERKEQVKSPWKMVVPLDVSPYHALGLSQEQKSPTTKNPVPKSPWQSNTQIGALVKSKSVIDNSDMKREEEDENEKFGKNYPLVLQVPKYNPQLIVQQPTLQTSEYFPNVLAFLLFFRLVCKSTYDDQFHMGTYVTDIVHAHLIMISILHIMFALSSKDVFR